MPIPKNKILAVKESLSLAEWIGARVTLKRRGSSYVGLCPFHAERTPSFSVKEDYFHCFGCGAGGDIIAFEMKHQDVGFETAVATLAKAAGIDIGDVKPGDTAKESIYRANEFAIERFKLNLNKSEDALKYVRGRIDQRTIDLFGLGLSDVGWRDFTNYAVAKGFSEESLVSAGLAKEGKSGVYDVFRLGRLMIPIRNESGNIVGFGGRSMDGGEPKYLNTPETRAYNKSQILFGLWESRTLIRSSKTLVLVEGYFDAMSLIGRGVASAAICGTNLTIEQAKKVVRVADRIIIAFDGDNAGRAAGLKAASLLSSYQSEVYIAPLHDKDIDELDGESVNGILAAAKGVVQTACEAGMSAHEVGELINGTGNIFRKIAELKFASDFFKISEAMFESRMRTREQEKAGKNECVSSKAPINDDDKNFVARLAARQAVRNEINNFREKIL